MIREDRFMISKRPYAVDLSSLRYDAHRCFASVNAVWFRRRKGALVACVGVLWDVRREAPFDALAFLSGLTDGRYGGDCLGRWDGSRYWGAQVPALIEAHLGLLEPVLAGFPAAPSPYDGWWRFE